MKVEIKVTDDGGDQVWSMNFEASKEELIAPGYVTPGADTVLTVITEAIQSI